MLPYSIYSLSRPNESLSALALCDLCASPLGIVAFFLLSAYLNKATKWNCSEYACVCSSLKASLPLRLLLRVTTIFLLPFRVRICSLYKDLSYPPSEFSDRQHHQNKQIPIQTTDLPNYLSHHNQFPPHRYQNESPRPRPLRPLPRHLHPPRHRLLRRHDLLHPRRRRQQLRLQHRRPTRRTHRRHLLPQIRLRQPKQRPPLRLLHLYL